MTLLSVKNLSISFGNTIVVDNISFDIDEEERVCIIGESGSGKTVTALAIQGLLPRNAHVTGSILFEGKELVGLSEKEFRSIRGLRIGCVFQEPQTALNPVVKIKHQLVYATRAHLGLKKKDVAMRAEELARMVELPHPTDIINRYPHELSGGQRQRVVIAMALSCRPAILIADEPTTALDATVERHILKLMDDRARQDCASVLMITHDMAVAYTTSQRVIVMKDGKIVESGATEQILRKPRHPYTQTLVDAARKTSLRKEG
ncbi:ABC transporter ATP-binding protein [Actinotignum urinale]|uniref:ABC transporter ATP-binding protein n=1 Tax=Actinotignum urinale TaxID=190146 RepID=A0AAW9HMQ4_9ACTO|nr:ABC transporter ATP-binding protein [Actinotignum urinale]MDY5132402.1 ABC transporter ATP-binding protein [Actinotignum urinale]MDY5151509.1 ABC transporter ATP-binding protein [Actinotignum urinale]MDY5155032.1 ABC transporter ATP-binding protein [Actinotignum urinale]MDY5160714.1 ABC transporter ATP-binding protein [Actinotignum urinale]WIK59276.1 ABC transporter ATP-binding protein [Actinotignum urinale]